MLDDLLVAAPSDAIHAEAHEHASSCPNCAEEHRRAGQALSALAARVPVRGTSALRARILSEVAAAAADENRNITLKSRPERWSLAQFATSKLALAAAASVLIAGAFLLWRGRDERQFDSSSFTFLGRAYAAEGAIFQTGRVVHI